MWRDAVLPLLRERGLGADRAAETLRLTGIGESLLVDLIGADLLRGRDPEVATYARVDAVDVRVSATGTPGRPAQAVVDETVAALLPRLEPYLFARGDEGWPEAIGRRIGERTLAIVEIGTAGQLGALLGPVPWLVGAQQVRPRAALDAGGAARPWARWVRDASGADVGIAVVAVERGGDMTVRIAVSAGRTTSEVERLAFLGGEQGRRRAANLACAELWSRLGVVA
jgi:hypothetical protein